MNDQILEILMLSKHVKRNELRMQLISKGFVISDRALREVVEKLITEGGVMIASSEKGYSLITNEQDLDLAMQYLKRKAQSISIRANSLLRNWKLKHSESQYALFI